MSSSFDASLLVAVLTPDADTHVTKRPQQCWAVSLSAVNACLSTGRQHPPGPLIAGQQNHTRSSDQTPAHQGHSQGNGQKTVSDSFDIEMGGGHAQSVLHRYESVNNGNI